VAHEDSYICVKLFLSVIPTLCSIRSDAGCRALVPHGHRRDSFNCHCFFHRRLNGHIFALALYTGILIAENDADLLKKYVNSSSGNMYDLYQNLSSSNLVVRVINPKETFEWLAVLICIPEICSQILL
jgi:hypothetical protein